MVGVQVFGIRKSSATRAAERFFKERGVAIHFVDLTQKPMSRGEIKRFTDKFGIAALMDTEGKAYVEAGLKYLKLSPEEMLQRVEREPTLLKLPLVRRDNALSTGHDEAAWGAMTASLGKRA